MMMRRSCAWAWEERAPWKESEPVMSERAIFFLRVDVDAEQMPTAMSGKPPTSRRSLNQKGSFRGGTPSLNPDDNSSFPPNPQLCCSRHKYTLRRRRAERPNAAPRSWPRSASGRGQRRKHAGHRAPADATGKLADTSVRGWRLFSMKACFSCTLSGLDRPLWRTPLLCAPD